ncbi:MAG: AAA family ATPase [Candidatus Binatia bacterium]
MKRKLVAILSADVQGYSRLMGEDEEGTIRTLTLYRDVMTTFIQQSRGRVVDAPGDNLLAEFGSVVDALRCAVAVQQELQERNTHLPFQRQMHFRIGLNLGDVIAEEERIYGEEVNIAARLEGLAEGGGICISGTVYDQVEGKLPFFYQSLGEQKVKNIARPVRVYRVLPAPPSLPLASLQSSAVSGQQSLGNNREPATEDNRGVPLTDQLLPPILVGRDVELTQLYGWLEKALRGERQIVFLTGEPGIGKTTLVNAFAERLRSRKDFRIVYGQCVEQYGAGDAYLPLLEAAHRLCRAPGGEQIIAALQTHAPTWLSQMPGVLSPAEFASLQQRVQGFTHERMLREMADALEAHTAKRGLIVVLEDLHWSDTATLEWLAYTARRREPAKLLIIGTYRPVEVLASGHPLRGVVQELRTARQCEEVTVTPLEEAAIEEYLSHRFAPSLFSSALLRTIYRRTDGNPLFVVNLAEYLARQGVVVEEDGKWVVTEGHASEIEKGVPETLRQLIERQIDRLNEEDQRLLEVASVVGMEFTAAAVAAGLQTTLENVETLCEQLERKDQFIHEQGVEEWPDGTVGGRYQFLHALYQNVLYERIAPGRRVRLHKQIGERKEAAFGLRAGDIATELAMHFEQGRDVRRAISYLERAGNNALQRSANVEATRHLTQALTLLPRLPASMERTRQELTLRLTLGTPMLALKGYGAPEVRHHYQQALALCRALDDPPDLFPVLWGLWVSHAVAGELSTAEELANQLARFIEGMEDAKLALQAHHALWTTLLARGDFTTCQLHVEEGLHLYHTDQHYPQAFVYGGHDPGVCCRIHGGFLYWLLGYPDRAVQLNREALALSRELSHPQTMAWALSASAMLHQFRGESIVAQQSAEEAIALSAEQQFAMWAAYSPVVLGWAMVAQGNQEYGLAQMHHGLAALRTTGTRLWQSQFLSLLANAYEQTGQVQEGLLAIVEALATAERNREHFYEAELYRVKGTLTLQARAPRGDSTRNTQLETEAETYFHKALAIARNQSAKSWELRAAVSLARLWQSQGRRREARELLEGVYLWFTEGFDTKDLREAETLLIALEGRLKKTEGGMRETASVRPEAKEEQHRAKDSGQRAKEEKTERETAKRISQLSDPRHQPRDAKVPMEHAEFRAPPVSDTFRCEGEYWTLAFGGVVCRVRNMRGFHYLAYLLQHPQEEFHALRLLTGDPAPFPVSQRDREDGTKKRPAEEIVTNVADSGELLDPQARAMYKHRIEDLRTELEEAASFNDQGRISKLQDELDFLTRELAQAIGLGGRARRAGSPAERARITVTKAIKNALKKIRENHPALGQYLNRTIKTGTFCSYAPDPRSPGSWQF